MAGAGQLTNVFDRYDVIGVKEEVSDMISDISPTDTPLQTSIGSQPTTQTFFEWQTDVLAAAAQNHQIDGFDVTTFTAVVPTVRLGNYTSLSQKDFMISGTVETTSRYGRESDEGYQATKAAKELKRDKEVNFTANNAAVAGDGSTARETGGIVAFLKTNTQSGTNGTDPAWGTIPTGAASDGTEGSSSESLLKTAVRQAYAAGGEPSIVMVGPFQKQEFSGFAGIAALRGNVSLPSSVPTTIMGAADLYVSDFGTLVIAPSRFQRPTDALVLDPTGIRQRELRAPRLEPLAKTGDANKWMWTCEAGLQVDNEDAHAIVRDLDSA